MNLCDLQDLSTADTNHAVEIEDRVWWVGHYLPDDPFQCHAYLIEHGDQSVLIDPGSYLTFDTVLKKVEEVIPFSKIRYFVLHHQDPDIAACLKLVDKMSSSRDDARFVTHWRSKALLRHYDVRQPFWLIDEHDWQLDLGGRVLKFIFTPYLHFPGAFCTFDDSSGVLFSSDLFGGFTPEWELVARDESHFESIRPFHEHYMPSREILNLGLMKLKEHPIKMIAPQHGAIIPSHLVETMFIKLKQVDCGLYALARDTTEIGRLSLINKSIKDITDAVIIYRDLKDISNRLLAILARALPAVSIEFYANINEGRTLRFAPESCYRGEYAEPPSECKDILSLDKNSWYSQHGDGYKKILLPRKLSSGKGEVEEHCLLIPLFPPEGGVAQAAAIIRFAHDVKMEDEANLMVEQISNTLGIVVERESIYRTLDSEREKLYKMAIRDPLTGLYNRFYMQETLNRLFNRHDHNKTESIVALLFDVDHFKQVNDTYGHGVGDKVLQMVASTLVEETRLSDLPVRFGGEEFAIFIVGHQTEDAIVIAEKIKNNISRMTFDITSNGLAVTVSVGVANRHQRESFADFIHRADLALYQAKNTGRNKVCVA